MFIAQLCKSKLVSRVLHLFLLHLRPEQWMQTLHDVYSLKSIC